MRAHVIENGKVINTININKLSDVENLDLVDASLGGVVGDRYVNGSFIAAPPEPRETPKIDLNSLTEAEKQSLINLVRTRP